MDRIICPFCGNTALFTYEENRIYQLKCKDCNNKILHEDTSYAEAKRFFERVSITDTYFKNATVTNSIVSVNISGGDN